MLLTLVVILLLIWAAVVGSLYSNFLTFYSNFSETENYNKAYYASIAALERAELVVRQREPGYVWSWWWTSYINSAWNTVWQTTGHYTTWSDWLISWTWFSYLSSWNSQWTSVLWRINSRTTRIPATWWWNVDRLLTTWDNALDYNKMDYENAEIFLLYYDKSNNNPYSAASCASWHCQKSTMTSISWKIMLPQKLYEAFGPLDSENALIPWSIKDDATVDRQLRWLIDETNPFTIYSTQAFDSNSTVIDWDTLIRESDLNKSNWTWVSLFFTDQKSPIKSKQWLRRSQRTIISPNETAFDSLNFKKILQEHNNYKQLQLRLALLNALKTPNNTIYPYLEYYLEFWTWVSDKYFTMDAEWKYGDYQVNLIIQRPTAKESILWSFTTIFE